MRNTREWIADNLDPPISERADVVPLQSLTDDIANALSLHKSLDCPYVSENAMILAAAGLDPNLEWAWTKLGLNFEQKEDGDSSESSDSCAVYSETQKEVDRQLWMSALSHDDELRAEVKEWEDPEWLAMKVAHSRNHDCRVQWECVNMLLHLHFRLLPLASNPN
eukprot:2493783-Rhodomonas_salina.1